MQAAKTPAAEPAFSSHQISPDSLNPAQYASVTHGQGPLLVIAGAGSGKTRTLVYRVAWLIQQGVAPESILLLTFTRRAAQEMLGRATLLTGPTVRRVMGGTFHAVANILLRQYARHLNLNPHFTIIDRGDAEGVINLLKSSLGKAGAGKRFPSKRVIMNLVSGAVNKSASIEELIRREYIHIVDFTQDIYEIKEHYQQFKQEHDLLDYDDLLIYWKLLLNHSAELRSQLSKRFQYILVDEYQDTNRLQAEIVQLLACEHNNVMAVGDDAQSIYSFRGADFYNIMCFADQFPGTLVIKLEENYRSTKPILQLTNGIIANAEKKFAKTLFTNQEGGLRPQLIEAANEEAEAVSVITAIKKRLEEGVLLSDIAVLFRSAYHSYKLEIELPRHGLDFDKRGGLKLTESAHIKDLLSFFRILINPWDNLSWNRILLQLDKVGPKTVQKILHTIQQAADPLAAFFSFQPGSTWKTQFTRLAATMQSLRQPGLLPFELFDLAMDYYQPVFEKIYYDDYPKRRNDLDQLKALIVGYDDLQSFVDDTALDPPDNSSVPSADPHAPSGGRLVLSTIHSAKGLEWDTVFVIGLAEGRFPNQHALPGDQWEEERRLFYVAATRAKQILFLCYPKEIVSADRMRHWMPMSPFLREINPGLYNTYKPARQQDKNSASPPGISANAKKISTSKQVVYTQGMLVSHPFFGTGKVLGMPGPHQVEVLFDDHGVKLLHLDYAKLSTLS